MLVPFLTYAYELEFEDRPDYEKIKFLLRKILMDRDYAIETRFDWSLRHGEVFVKMSRNNRHSSISSCDIHE